MVTKSTDIYPATTVAYTARGCEYVLESYGDDGYGAQSVVVWCHGPEGKLLWSGCAVAYPDDRNLDVVRRARKVKDD